VANDSAPSVPTVGAIEVLHAESLVRQPSQGVVRQGSGRATVAHARSATCSGMHHTTMPLGAETSVNCQ
jgi:hypothetical protein